MASLLITATLSTIGLANPSDAQAVPRTREQSDGAWYVDRLGRPGVPRLSAADGRRVRAVRARTAAADRPYLMFAYHRVSGPSVFPHLVLFFDGPGRGRSGPAPFRILGFCNAYYVGGEIAAFPTDQCRHWRPTPADVAARLSQHPSPP